MRIGIDARWFFRGNPSGRVWTRYVVEALARLHPQHEYILFLRPSDRGCRLPGLLNGLELHHSASGPGIFANAICLPVAAARAGVDVLITQYFASPSKRFRQITIVHDVIFATDPQYFTRRERAYFMGIKPLLRYADLIVTVSESTREDMKVHGFIRGSQEAVVIGNGVRSELLEAPDIPGLVSYRRARNLPARYILYLGRIDERKNVEGLVRAIPHLQDRDVKLVIGGREDGGGAILSRTIARMGVKHRVTQIGHCTDEELPNLYRAATLFAFVSHREGFGLPPLEAMASGTPVLVANRPSLPEVCGDAALYCDPDDPTDIARMIDWILGDESLQDVLRARGRERARCFTWDRTAEALVDLAERIYIQPSRHSR